MTATALEEKRWRVVGIYPDGVDLTQFRGRLSLVTGGRMMTETVWDRLLIALVAAMAIFIIIFHAAMRPPSERLPEACQMAHFYSDPVWPWANHVKCIDGDFAP